MLHCPFLILSHPIIFCPSCLYHAALLRDSKASVQEKLPQNYNELTETLRDNKDRYQLLCQHLLPAIVGKSNWNKRCLTTKLTDLADISDEALMLVLIKNNWFKWEDMARNRVETSSEPTLYTTVFDNQTGLPSIDPDTLKPTTEVKKNIRGANLTKEWSDDGLVEYGRLYNLVKADRIAHPDFDKDFMEYLKAANPDLVGKNKKNEPRKPTGKATCPVEALYDSDGNSIA